jgi:hypothetical protein
MTDSKTDIAFCSACEGTHLEIPLIKLNVPFEIKNFGLVLTHYYICPVAVERVYTKP